MLGCFIKHRCFLLLVAGLCTLSSVRADETLDARIIQLDEAYQALAQEIYQADIIESAAIDDPGNLLEQFNLLQSKNQIVRANQLIFKSMHTLSRQSDHPAIVAITDNLLKQNERQMAEQIYSLVKNSDDQSNLPYLSFTFAKYFARHRQWQRVKQFLKDTFSELSGDDVNYAYLLQGSALQHLKQHRKSVESYGNIPETSAYYVHAQLNTALASIRQGWITEARAIIEKIIPVSQSRENHASNELTNRIYLVLGYALLQKEYYRDARKAFRSIGIDSNYSNRALMGIALTAINQGDYVGGLNAATRLKQKPGQDLSVDEAYLVVPYIYEKLEQPLSIEAAFSESIDHYQKRLLQLNALKRNQLEYDNIQLEEQSGDLILDKIEFNFSQQYPRHLLKNRHNLGRLATVVSASRFVTKNSLLATQYERALNEAIAMLIDERIQFINSYLNQSRFGLARHYDNQQEAVQ